jgi:16S rRNA processing protein RimM
VGEDFVVIGRVSKPHGVKGEIRIDYFNLEDPRFFSQYQVIYLPGDEGEPRPYRLSWVRPLRKFVVVQLEGIRTREEAERLKGKEVLIHLAELPPLEEDEYYWHEILGMLVVTEQGREVGKVTDIYPTGSNDVYVVHKEEKEFLIPATHEVIIAIDTKARTMVIRPPKGLVQEDDL